MSRAITLGEGFPLDLAALIDTRLLIQANSGGGKSWCLRRLLEQTHGHVQQLVIDPEGEFASLRERFDYVHAAKQHGDTAADPRSAKLLAERLLQLGVSAVLDIYELKAHDRVRFVGAFLEAMVDAPKSLWHPVLVVVDEAHVFCPQQGEAESAEAVIDLATRGRKRGYCAVLATQRLSKLHKDAAAELNNKLIGRTGLDVDMKRAGDELGFTGRDQVHQLRELGEGEFFAFGRALSREVRKVKIGPVQTTHPKAGARLAFNAPPPTAKIKSLLPQLADLPAEAEQKHRTEEMLKQQVASLSRQLGQLARARPAEAPPTTPIEVPVISADVLQRLEEAAEHFIRIANQVPALVTELREVQAGAFEEAKQLIDKARAVSARRPLSAPVSPVTPRPRATSPRPDQSRGSGADLSSGERKILTALAQYPDGRTKTQVAILTGYAHNGGGFNNYLSGLRSKGWLEGRGDQLRITDAGADALGTFDPLPIGRELLDHWLGQLDKAPRLILGLLAAQFPASLSKEEVAAAVGYEANGGGFNNALSKLRTLELISGRGRLQASEDLLG